MPRSKKQEFVVSRSALVGRINRKLKAQGQLLKGHRGGDWRHDPNRWFIVDVDSGAVVQAGVDLLKLAHDHGCLASYETFAEQTAPKG